MSIVTVTALFGIGVLTNLSLMAWLFYGPSVAFASILYVLSMVDRHKRADLYAKDPDSYFRTQYPEYFKKKE